MNRKIDVPYLLHMRDAIALIESWSASKTFEDFAADEKLQSAITRQLEIIGEAVLRLSVDLRDRHPDTPWGDIVGMRKRLIHEYFGVDLAAVWLTVVKDVPELKQMMQDIVQTL